MAELKADVLVLGAGMVGVGAALHLQQRGRDVILVDRHELAGEETSFGNAGLIECASVFPYMFPRDFGQILKYALNGTPQVRYQLSDLPLSCHGCCAISSRPRRRGRCTRDGGVAPDPAQPGRA